MIRYKNITLDPLKMGGVPCIRGLRIPVATIVRMVAARMSTQAILDAYPDLTDEDISASLQFAADALCERELPLASAS